MAVDTKSDQNATQVVLAGPLTIYEATATAMQLMSQAHSAEPVCVDLSAVTEIDCAGLQLLLAMQKECAITLFSNPSSSVIHVLRASGFDRHLHMDAT